ncbi:MAG: primosomal protein N', partial [Planctomycetota bacterium]
MPEPSAESLFPDSPSENEGVTNDPVGYARVALERGIDAAEGGFTYAVPAALGDLRVGERVTVPLGRGNRPAAGIVVERMGEAHASIKTVKPISARQRGSVSLPDDLVELARWIAAYYHCPLGMVFAGMLPAAVKHGTGTRSREQVRAVASGGDASRPEPSKLQRAVLDAAGSEGRWWDAKALADAAGAKSVSPVRQLVEKGWLETQRTEAVVSDLDLRAQRAVAPTRPPELTPAQAEAVSRLAGSLDAGFGVHLLHGVTGSGKTEVYLRVIDSLLHRDETSAPLPGVIVLVPEIALTPQTVGRFLARFPGGGVAVLHSGLTAAQRHAQWRRIRDGEARVVVGARSAVFAPLPKVGLIVVDEEHESSYKQDQLPRYHARDVAIRRAQRAGCPVVLGSATPSLESWHNAACDRANLVTLPDRVPGATLPDVELVDLAEERRERRGVHLLSRRLEALLQQNLDAGGQAILLLNRRGYANYLACPDHRCGWMMRCHHCDVTMVYHRDLGPASGGGVTRCHHCDAEQVLATACPECGRKVSVFGLGTQKVQAELERKFPGARLARMDADSMRTARDYQQTLDAFAAGQTDILLGTQMIAKGLDVPNVRLVGVVSGDTSLNFPDFRASERTFQLIAQVAGRAGRGEHRGRVVVQTFNPDDPAIRRAADHDYVGFAEEEIATRQAAGLPPVGRMARIVLRDTDPAANLRRATRLGHAGRGRGG